MMQWEKLLSAKRSGDQGNVPNYLRSRFEQDYDRIIFSSPFRRLQDKTQVFPLPEDDFVHTRLTHSLEVSVVGRSLGKEIGKTIIEKHQIEKITAQDIGAIVGAASLAHDLGNPPFGHSGEDCISSFYINHALGSSFQERVSKSEWKDLTQFEGNAQGFRILNSKVYGGLKLTYATLGAFTKYPLSSHSDKEKDRKSTKKFGYYQSDENLFSEIAKELGLIEVAPQKWRRHPLAFLVEAADDICYNIIDLEDGCRLGLVTFNQVKELLAPLIGERYSEEKLQKIPTINEKLGTLRALAINQLINQCKEAFITNESDILLGKFDCAITDIIPSKKALENIINISIQKIYRSKQVLEKEAGGFRVIETLLSHFTEAAIAHLGNNIPPKSKSIFNLIPDTYRHHLTKEKTVYQTLQLVNDFIGGLTDSHAVRIYSIISGNRLN